MPKENKSQGTLLCFSMLPFFPIPFPKKKEITISFFSHDH